MNNKIANTFQLLDNLMRKTSVAQIGGFRPSDSPTASWFGGTGVGLPGETLPVHQDKVMFPLLQVNVTELPYVPSQLEKIGLFIVFLNRVEIPFDKPHGEGWLIREYTSIEQLVPLPLTSEPEHVRPFPIKWELSERDAPSWEIAGSLVDMSAVHESDDASNLFFERYKGISGTKMGGYPYEIQHGDFGDSEFVFQIGSEEKPQWMWGDDGIGYFLRDKQGHWEFQCQFY
jgi:uncharacterized protein YwqG